MNRKNTITDAREILRRRIYSDPERAAELEQTHREMALGMKIRELREQAGMTQQQLADQIGTRRSAISRIEDADYDGHSVDTLSRVAKALGMNLIIDFQPRTPPCQKVGMM